MRTSGGIRVTPDVSNDSDRCRATAAAAPLSFTFASYQSIGSPNHPEKQKSWCPESSRVSRAIQKKQTPRGEQRVRIGSCVGRPVRQPIASQLRGVHFAHGLDVGRSLASCGVAATPTSYTPDSRRQKSSSARRPASRSRCGKSANADGHRSFGCNRNHGGCSSRRGIRRSQDAMLAA